MCLTMGAHNTVILDRRNYAKGQLILKEGEFGQQAYLIQSGEVSVYVTNEGRNVELTRLQTGEIFGEMAVISDSPRWASVRAVQDTTVIIINRFQFEEKLKESDGMIRAITKMLTKRIAISNLDLVNKRSDLSDLQDTARIIYQNIAEALPYAEAQDLHEHVLPQLDNLLKSIEYFQSKHCEPSDKF